MHPKVSILIPCYNAEQWIAQAIESALAQTYPNKEVIVVDDGSTDNSLRIIKQFGHAICWETGPNQGGNMTRNRLLEISTGEWLQYLDADDYLLPDKVTNQVQWLAKKTDIDLIYSPSILEYCSGSYSYQEILPIPKPYDPWILLVRWYLPQTGSPLWRKQALIDVGRWKIDQPCCQEHELYLRLLIAGKRFAYVESAGSVYRQWSEATVCKKNKPETYQRRLEITDKLEQYLKNSRELTPSRQYAINLSRFDCARMIWLFDPIWANRLINQIRATDPTFVPTGGAAAPPTYRLMFRLFGFAIAEHTARFKRKILQNSST
jgi:glycosyltransferase involved in cell wall biosynthesis